MTKIKPKSSIERAAFVLILATYSLLSHSDDARFDSEDPQKIPFSVPRAQIEDRINNDPAADGIIVSIDNQKSFMRIDVIAVPGETSVAAVTRVVLMVSRLAESDYDQMRFSDAGEDLYVINGDKVRDIGKQFVWGEEGKGQNPIHLIRLFVDGLTTPDGKRVAPEYTGSLLGDTTKAMTTLSQQFNRVWVMRTVEIL